MARRVAIRSARHFDHAAWANITRWVSYPFSFALCVMPPGTGGGARRGSTGSRGRSGGVAAHPLACRFGPRGGLARAERSVAATQRPKVSNRPAGRRQAVGDQRRTVVRCVNSGGATRRRHGVAVDRTRVTAGSVSLGGPYPMRTARGGPGRGVTHPRGPATGPRGRPRRCRGGPGQGRPAHRRVGVVAAPTREHP